MSEQELQDQTQDESEYVSDPPDVQFEMPFFAAHF